MLYRAPTPLRQIRRNRDGMLIATICAWLLMPLASLPAETWKKHVVMEQGHCNTAVAIDVNGDRLMDVIASHSGRVSLFLAPNWGKEIVLLKQYTNRPITRTQFRNIPLFPLNNPS